jgi:hypothetical protein
LYRSAVLDLVLTLVAATARDSLIVVQPETVLRWRRERWSTLWRYRFRGRWRGGRGFMKTKLNPIRRARSL